MKCEDRIKREVCVFSLKCFRNMMRKKNCVGCFFLWKGKDKSVVLL